MWMRGADFARLLIRATKCLVGALLRLSRRHRLPTAPVIALLQDAMPRPGLPLVHFNDTRCGSLAEPWRVPRLVDVIGSDVEQGHQRLDAGELAAAMPQDGQEVPRQPRQRDANLAVQNAVPKAVEILRRQRIAAAPDLRTAPLAESHHYQRRASKFPLVVPPYSDTGPAGL